MEIDQATIIVIATTATEPPAGARKAPIFLSQNWLSACIDADDLLPFDSYAVSFSKEEDKKPDIAGLNHSSSTGRTISIANGSYPNALKTEDGTGGRAPVAGN